MADERVSGGAREVQLRTEGLREALERIRDFPREGGSGDALHAERIIARLQGIARAALATPAASAAPPTELPKAAIDAFTRQLDEHVRAAIQIEGDFQRLLKLSGTGYHCTYCDGPHHEAACPNRCAAAPGVAPSVARLVSDSAQLQARVNEHANALHDYFAKVSAGDEFDWVEYHRGRITELAAAAPAAKETR